MKRLKAISGILAIFALGIMTGVLGTGLVVKQRIESFHEKGSPPIRPMFMKRIGNRLDLTPAQRVEVEKILDTLQIELREVRRNFYPKIQAAFDNCFEQIKKHLTDSQKKKLDIIRKKLPGHFPPGKDFRRLHRKHRNHPKGMHDT
ncbi:MAG: hypothetical protein ACKVE4_12125 [Dissulfuribacterales bacterium]